MEALHINHPLLSQAKIMIEDYKQMTNNFHATEKMPDYLGEKFFMEELREYGMAATPLDKMDALGDCLICLAGAFFSLGLKKENIPPHFVEKPFVFCEVMGKCVIEKALNLLKQNPSHQAKAIHLFQIWNMIIFEAMQNNFNIKGAYYAIVENNKKRIKRDAEGNAICDPTTGKVQRIELHPNLKEFLQN